MFNDEEITIIRDVIDTLKGKISDKHEKYVFFSSKGWNEKDARFIMYIHGGACLEISINKNNKVSYKTFSEGYCKYFSSEQRGKEIRKKLTDPKGLEKEYWREICCAFENWATKEKKPEHERDRQTAICNLNEKDTEFSIFDMEENVILPCGHNGELDMAAIRFENGKPMLALIEYKCTEGGVTGSTDFVKHFHDMCTYYKKDRYKEKFVDLYNQKQRLLREEEIKASDCGVEIVFLISHIWELQQKTNINNKEDEKSKYVKKKQVFTSLKKMQNQPKEPWELNAYEDYIAHINDLKILIIENEEEKLSTKHYMTYEEAIKYLE